jgi:hypothetical protein
MQTISPDAISDGNYSYFLPVDLAHLGTFTGNTFLFTAGFPGRQY